jgi:hypothetical protein
MSDEREEDRGHTTRCLDVDFSGEYGVRVTSRELMKNGMTGTMSSEGFTTANTNFRVCRFTKKDVYLRHVSRVDSSTTKVLVFHRTEIHI